MRRFLLLVLVVSFSVACDRPPKGRATPAGVLDRPKIEANGAVTKIPMH